MNSPLFFLSYFVLSALVLVTAMAAVSFRNLVHCGLSLAFAFLALGAFYILLGAEFLGFVQILVYVGAVAVLIMFVILLAKPGVEERRWGWRDLVGRFAGVGVSLAVFLALLISVFRSPSLAVKAPEAPVFSIAVLGEKLVTEYVLPLQATGLLLTVAVLAAVIFASQEVTKK